MTANVRRKAPIHWPGYMVATVVVGACGVAVSVSQATANRKRVTCRRCRRTRAFRGAT